ncbi:tetratricopeptide repeat protein [Calycomorphotria hydatis]|uniref:PBS lyase HEAT-like repeat protein n=1 Tax=Calycomorphotria hydatis TaxID=2528027 RepID=A0A517TBD9_9PLAN|nr:tetratricopeptide repeat protein [Calycomorphotria hydatis]QDT65689.1 PBS lyase HEAT-like repeat protein [Calycomorphotria hydatis]
MSFRRNTVFSHIRHSLVVCMFLSGMAGLLNAAESNATPKIAEGDTRNSAVPHIEVEESFLGQYRVNRVQNRYFTLQLKFSNPTGSPVELDVESLKLKANEQVLPVGDGKSAGVQGIRLGHKYLPTNKLLSEGKLKIDPGKSETREFGFYGIAGQVGVPALSLTFKFDEYPAQTIDLVALAAERLHLETELIGPNNILALLTVHGELTHLGTKVLVDKLVELIDDDVQRFVVRWPEFDNSKRPSSVQWLINATNNLGTPYNDSSHPVLPSGIMDLQLSGIPDGSASKQKYPDLTPGYHVHEKDQAAVAEALRSVVQRLPAEEIRRAISEGHSLVRPPCVLFGGSRLGDPKLLMKLTDDSDQAMRLSAIHALRHYGEDEVIEHLVQLAKSANQDIATAALDSLAGSRYAKAHFRLLELLEAGTAASQRETMQTLSRHPRPLWSEMVYDIATDQRSEVRGDAIRTLARVGHPQLDELMEEVLFGRDVSLGRIVFAELASRDDPWAEELAIRYTLKHLQKQPPTSDMQKIIHESRDPRFIEPLHQLFNKQKPGSRGVLITHLGVIGDMNTANLLADNYSKMSNDEKVRALRTLSQLDSPRLLDISAEAIESKNSSEAQTATRGLQTLGSPQAVDLLANALRESKNASVWSSAASALANIGSPKARAVLLEVMNSAMKDKQRRVAMYYQQLQQRSPAMRLVVDASQSVTDQKWDRAEEIYTHAVEIDPLLSRAWSGRAHVRYQLEKFEDARDDYREALKTDPFNGIAITGLAIMTVQLDGDIETAISLVNEHEDHFSQDPLFAYNTACVYGVALKRFAGSQKEDEQLDEAVELDYQNKALALLSKSIELGFSEIDWMKQDPDLELLRDLPGFQALTRDAP